MGRRDTSCAENAIGCQSIKYCNHDLCHKERSSRWSLKPFFFASHPESKPASQQASLFSLRLKKFREIFEQVLFLIFMDNFLMFLFQRRKEFYTFQRKEGK